MLSLAATLAGIIIVGGIGVDFGMHYKLLVARSHASFLGPRESVLLRLRDRAPSCLRISEHFVLI